MNLNSQFTQLIIILFGLFTNPVLAQEQATAEGTTVPAENLNDDLVTYPASFFDRYNPISALDMVNQVPGFQVNDDEFTVDARGFSNSSSGNVLIDDRRPSAKSDNLTAILERIPAHSVEKLELIRSQVRNIDLRGQTVLVNVILKEGTPATIQWKVSARKTTKVGKLEPEASISLANNWNGIDYNAGINFRSFTFGRIGNEKFFDSDRRLQETRVEDRYNRNLYVLANLNLAGWLGETFMNLNGTLNYEDRVTTTNLDSFNRTSDFQRHFFFDDDAKDPVYELGFDMERSLLPSLTAKGIILYVTGVEDVSFAQVNTDVNGLQTLDRLAVGDKDKEEFITRVEFDWTPLDGHLVQANFERAVNTLDNTLVQTDDTGAGPIEVDVPGANSRVREERWDFLVKDTWLLGSLELDYGLGAEASTISQRGDSELKRDFFFFKPQTSLTYNWENSDQSRLSMVREVAQLDLEDFVSATEFLDSDIALGNPNIKPDATWKLELSHEKRFGGIGVFKLTLFHYWISDVLDLLPITDSFEAPGNIGDGRHWGARLETTLPLDWTGLQGARLDLKGRIQGSSVTDPVTGEKRPLSIDALSLGPILYDIQNNYGYQVDFRQDFQGQQIAWGWGVIERGRQIQYKVNELARLHEGAAVSFFVETTRWFGIKIRFDAEDIINLKPTRHRTLYTGRRELSPLEALHFRNRTRGIRLALRFSGNF